MIGSLLKGTSLYGLTRVCSRAVPYLLLPYLTLYLSREEFGSLAVFQASLGFLILFISLSTSSALNRYYFELPTEEIASWTRDALSVISANTVVVILALWWFLAPISAMLNISPMIVLSVPLVAFTHCISTIVLDRWRHQMKLRPYALFYFSQMIIDVCATIALVTMLRWGVMGRISGLGLSQLVVGLIGLVLLSRAAQLRLLHKNMNIRPMLAYSLPLIPYSLGLWVITSLDRYLLTAIAGPAEAGVYSIGFLFGSVILLCQDAVVQAWGPIIFTALSRGDAASRAGVVRLYYLVAAGSIVVGLSLSVVVPRMLPYVVEESFAAAGPLVPWITWAFVINALRAFLVHFLLFAKKNHLLMLTALVPAAVHVVISYSLISTEGALGAAKAILVSLTLSALVTFHLVRKSIDLPWLLRQ